MEGPRNFVLPQKSQVARLDDGAESIGRAELAIEILQMPAYGGAADGQLVGDPLSRVTGSHQPKKSELARGDLYLRSVGGRDVTAQLRVQRDQGRLPPSGELEPGVVEVTFRPGSP
jgi:hypothetical protein